MSNESIVYGCIKELVLPGETIMRREINRHALNTLPSVEQWPFLYKEMFAAPEHGFTLDGIQTEVTHFGASYFAVEYEWRGWIECFEALLEQMYWVSAVVHLETDLSGLHTFTWESSSESHLPGQPLSQTRCEWSRESLAF